MSTTRQRRSRKHGAVPMAVTNEADFGSLPIETRYHLIARENLALQDRNERLERALRAFIAHFGPIEDNRMLNPGARNCFKLAREAISVAPKDQD